MKYLISILLLSYLIAACMGGAISNFFQKRLQKTVKLKDGGFVFKLWRDSDVPLYMMVRFFNVTNPHRVLRGDKPILQEVGPYVYQEDRENHVERFSDNNETVAYRMKTTYTFRPDYSQGTEDDIITTLNVPYAAMMEKTSNLSGFELFLIREIFANNEERLFVRKTVRELLFEGYYQESLEAMSDLAGEEFLPNNTFGFFYGKNGTLTDLLEIYTGIGNESLVGQTKSWEGQTQLTYWDNEYCNMINGSDGSMFSPWLTRNVTLKIFSPELCRSLHLTYEKDVWVTAFPGYRFVVPRDLLASPEENPENECFCKGGQFGPCLKTGVLRLAPCRGGVPVVISWPHFYNADGEYVNQSIGLRPDKDLHETFLIIEPYSGLIRRASKRFQINVELKPNKLFRDMKRVPRMLFPILWVEESKISRFRTRSHFRKMIKLNSDAANLHAAATDTQSPEGDFGEPADGDDDYEF